MKSEPVCSAVALGYFDGVHQGHRRILRAAVLWAKQNGCVSAAFTFVFDSRRTKAPDILSLQERCRRLAACGVQRVECLPFDRISSLSPQQFVTDVLRDRLHAAAVFCGESFRFGKDAAGDVSLLGRLCREQGIVLRVQPTAMADGQPVSATRIRTMLATGRVAAAAALMDEPYAVELPVRHGAALGRTLGFPTVNQSFPPQMLRPADGVYRTAARIDGVWVPAATCIGTRPTVTADTQEPPVTTCESFLCRWQGDAYDKTVRLVFLEYLWAVRRYDTPEELADCIRRAAEISCDAFDAETRSGAGYLVD